MPITFGMKGSSYLCSQITGGAVNTVSLHVDIPRTGGRGFDLPSEDSLQQYLKFPNECFLSLSVFENRVLRRIFRPKRDEVTGDWRKMHNEELHSLYSSPSTENDQVKEDVMGMACSTIGGEEECI
jgi:hypothetical protein